MVPSFSIIVPTFRRPDALRAALEALLALDYPNERYEVIIVDDDSSDATAQVVSDFSDVDLTLAVQERQGAARARNLGAQRAKGELLLFVDDDILVEPEHLGRHCAARERYGDPIVSGVWEFTPTVTAALEATPFGRYRFELERHFQKQARGRMLDDGRYAMTMLASTNLSIRRELFWQLGGFGEEFPVAGAEDQDFSQRARAAGCQLLLDPAIRCLHNDNRLTLRAYCEREERSAKTMPFLARNFPREFAQSAYIRENRPIQRDDPPALVAKKLIKSTLSRGPVLEGLHRLVGVAEAASLPDRVLRRLYRLLLGLYLFRGFRSTWSQAARSAGSSG